MEMIRSFLFTRVLEVDAIWLLLFVLNACGNYKSLRRGVMFMNMNK